MKILAVASIALACASLAHAQINVLPTWTSPVASAIRADHLDFAPHAAPTTFTTGGMTFTRVSNPTGFWLGNGFTWDVSVVGFEAINADWVGVAGGTTDTALWHPVNPDTSADVSYNLSADSPILASLWLVDHTASPGVKEWQSNPTYWDFWQSTSDPSYYLAGVEDGYIPSAAPDKDFDEPTLLIHSTPVPEPSSYGLIAGLVALAAVSYKRFRKPAVAA